MTRRAGSLFDAIGYGADVATRVGIVIIDEQSGDDDLPLHQVSPDVLAIRRLLIHTGTLGCHVWLIEFREEDAAGLPRRTDLRIRACVNPISTTVITKSTFSAFQNETLHASLQARGIERIVVAGYSTTRCVKETVIGGAWPRFNFTTLMETSTPIDGALTRGYQVLSCMELLRPHPLTCTDLWFDAAAIDLYAKL